jgi:cell wall-associated NlpC family hydrolase
MAGTMSSATGLRQQIVDSALAAAKKPAGRPYTPNGRTTSGFDCSGFVTYVYKQVFPKYQHLDTQHIETSTTFAKVAAPLPGDLIFFPSGVNPYDKKSHANHVGIVLDAHYWIGSQTSTGVAKVLMANIWWSARKKFFLRYSAAGLME